MPTEADAIRLELLVLRCRRRDAAAPAELVERFQRPLLYYLRRLLPTEADAWDVSQETWLSVFRSIDTLRDARALPAFIYQTARNAAFAQRRRRKLPISDGSDVDAETGDDFESAESFAFAKEVAARLHAALGQLALAHRDVLTLHFLQELSIDQIAEVIGIPAGTVKSRIFHAKVALRNLLAERGLS